MFRNLALMIMLVAASSVLAQWDDNQPKSLPDSITYWSWELGAEFGDHKYEEPNFMKETGTYYGASGAIYRHLPKARFGLELSYGVSKITYDGGYSDGQGGFVPFTAVGISDNFTEARVVAGPLFQLENRLTLLPFLGFGYRAWNDKFFTIPGGYLRESRYRYVPIGLRLEKISGPETDERTLSAVLEFDYFIGGTQFSRLSDVSIQNPSPDTISITFPDITNDQSSGHGFRASVGYDLLNIGVEKRLKLTVYYRFWDIDDSASEIGRVIVRYRDQFGDVQIDNSNMIEALEPANTTTQYGVRLSIVSF